MFTALTFIILYIAWIFLSGKFDLFHLSLGLISCLIVATISNDLLFNERQKSLPSRFKEAFRFVAYSFWLLWQIVLANFHVIGLAISPRQLERELDPHIFTFKTRLTTDFAKFVLANSITLTPGTVTVRIVDDVFHVHAISVKAVGDFGEAESMSEMERKVAWVFEGGR